MDSASSTPSDARPPAFIHVDCDGLWAVQACYGAPDPTPAGGDPFFKEALPAALDVFRELNLPATFFVIGRDLANAGQRELLRTVIKAQHEIANHSLTHRMDLRTAADNIVWQEIEEAQEQIQTHLGVKPVGFRAPGFSFQPLIHTVLMRNGFTYDSSVFASPWGIALRTARQYIGRAAPEDQQPYGRIADAFATREPHLIERRRRRLMEIPVSVSQGFRLPVHASFALLRADQTFVHTLDWHVQQGLPFVWLIHLIDLCDTRTIPLPTPRWAGPLFRQSGERKRQRLRFMLEQIKARFNVVRTDAWVSSELDRLPQ